ncbi:MAG: hypothetical protein FJX11_23855 [Alphaproteobacteria bacterium]|nr:hypothetical protein [Alphaproteobacteria bacterium]
MSWRQQHGKWSVDRLSLDLNHLNLDIGRHFATSEEDLETLAELFGMRLCFTKVERIVLSDFSTGEIISDFEQKDTAEETTYRLTLADRSFIEITAAGFAELPY